MATTSDISRGMILKLDGSLYSVVEFGENKCNCGRTFPVISKIDGRGNEMLIDKHNKKIHSTWFNFLFKNDKAVKQFQVLFDESSFNINLWVDQGFTEKSKEDYMDIMKSHFSFDHYEMKMNEKFHIGKNLKHTYIVDKRKK